MKLDASAVSAATPTRPVFNWVPQPTNPAGTGGELIFTNTPNAATNNFWRIRSVP